MKFSCKVKNTSDFTVNILNAEITKNNYFCSIGNCLEDEPTFPYSPNTSYDIGLYIYVNNKFTNKDEIEKELNHLNIKFITIKQPE